ncbi:hypothetical protein CHELA20_51290 [Hyphomicrobiales bacterium]|nr:hypothetical protein CHELA41_23722 [Hyphomicrobiales bacterium]CAH1675019.1 hypothetical protein CHELA20_51290 [Hyphomicrobiales bacterium]
MVKSAGDVEPALAELRAVAAVFFAGAFVARLPRREPAASEVTESILASEREDFRAARDISILPKRVLERICNVPPRYWRAPNRINIRYNCN